MNAEISGRLRAEIPSQLIKQINNQNYISGHTAIDRLIQATDNEWSFDIGQVIHSPGHVAMQGELTIGGQTRSAWGEAKSTNNAKEELFKNAETDALKRCARLFGVALALYGDLLDEQTGEVTQRPAALHHNARQQPDNRRYPVQPQHAPQTTTAPRGVSPENMTEPATGQQVKAIFAIGRKLDIDVKPWVGAEFGGRDIDSLTRAEASLIIEFRLPALDNQAGFGARQAVDMRDRRTQPPPTASRRCRACARWRRWP